MREKREKISFWLTIVSFIGSVIFIANMIWFEKTGSPETNDCIEKMLYYQHRADSLQNVLENQNR